MRVNFFKSVATAAVATITIGSVLPAIAAPNNSGELLIAQRGGACRRIVSNQGGPEQPRAVAGLDNNQLPVYENPNDIYNPDMQPVGVLKIGDEVTLADPYQEAIARDGNTTSATIMVAINDGGVRRWIPVTDARSADGSPVGRANLGMCTGVRALW